MNTWQSTFMQAVVAVVVVAAGLAVYDRTVRAPATLRLAVVDVNALYAAATRSATQGALDLVDRAKAATIKPEAADEALGRIEKSANDFGPRLGKALDSLAAECQCTVVAMAAVYGADSGIRNYTQLMAERLGVELPR
jgi:hypothetical protein